MSDPIGATSAVMSDATRALSRSSVAELAATQPREAAALALGAADPARLAQGLVQALERASEAYRRALSAALDPGPIGGATGASGATSWSGGGGVSAAAVPDGAGGSSVGGGALLHRTERAADESLTLLVEAHRGIMERQVGVMSATSTVQAVASASQRSGQNIDTLIRGQ